MRERDLQRVCSWLLLLTLALLSLWGRLALASSHRNHIVRCDLRVSYALGSEVGLGAVLFHSFPELLLSASLSLTGFHCMPRYFTASFLI
ncbi:hypothetical protein Baya_8689 [Bagarius yarrelli]|uniref:Uncharacterized protein n=1 Tax=Bagarius yarrelli TaxID=175774 RepID=A0A556U7U0_BAGYA|nr:hypothetical protein Baya_8689 [Bagarius yarrelli]